MRHEEQLEPAPGALDALAARAAATVLGGGGRLLDRLAGAAGDASRTVRFLQGRLAFEPRPDDIFVASYPRSGTTWTQLIVHYLVTGASTPSFSHISEVSPWWERSLAWRADAARELSRLPGPRVFKTHLPYRWLPAGARYVYLTRDPADVAVSYYHLYRRYLRFDGGFEEFFERFVRGDVQYRSWFKHTAGWMEQRGNPRALFLSYEEMKSDARGSVQRLADFLDVPISAARLDEITRCTDFDAMKAHEEKFDHIGELCQQWGVRSGDFLRAGRVAGGDGYLSPEQRDLIHRMMARSMPRPDREWRLPAFLH